MTLTPRLGRRGLLAFVVLLPATACFSGWGRSRDPFREGPGGSRQISVRVENQNFGDAVIHASRGGERVRLGNVVGKTEETFTMDWTFSLSLEFEVNIVGGGRCLVTPLSVDPGDKVWVRIPTHLSASPCYSGKG
ncbi:MAG: hypothetical protein P8170_03765 [Gemmatimonadota bacterium]